MIVTCTLRTMEEQVALYAQRREHEGRQDRQGGGLALSLPFCLILNKMCLIIVGAIEGCKVAAAIELEMIACAFPLFQCLHAGEYGL